MHIPEDLVSAVSERRVIPFVGAGFSATVGLPDWNQLLARLAAETEGSLPYDELRKHTGGDFLQIAEYLYLKSDRRIGPLRHVIERGLPEHLNPTLSAAHVELVNLGAPQIYTTNYDDLIESTYRALGLPVNVVALGKDVAVAGQQTTQVIKYHGDLRHESTLVLTESSYFGRLDFESAMDVKFRADLLGRSVLFMGYSFRDINIRLIWFKLNQMMEDIPNADRRQSYIVRLESNPVLEELYEAVGLRTIVLDSTVATARPRRTQSGGGTREELEITSLADFLAQLAVRACGRHGRIPGTSSSMFASINLVERAERECDRLSKLGAAQETYYWPELRSLRTLMDREVPPALAARVSSVLDRALLIPPRRWDLSRAIIIRAQQHGPSTGLTLLVIRLLLGSPSAVPPGRLRERALDATDIDWSMIWKGKLESDHASEIVERLEKELGWNSRDHADYDIAYAADAANRVANGQIFSDEDGQLSARIKDLLASAVALYPAIASIPVNDDGPPELGAVLAQIDARRETLPQFDDLAFEVSDEPLEDGDPVPDLSPDEA